MSNESDYRTSRAEIIFIATYFAAYFGYLFIHQESELHHWVSLIVIPLVGLWIVRGRPPLRLLLASIGLERGRLLHGLKWPILVGLGLQIVQLMNSSNRAALSEILGSSWGWVVPVVALPLLMVTVGPTEEVFFRGIIQGRFSDALKSDWAGIGIATAAFIIYHVPYAYLNPNWPSAGNLAHAAQLAAVNGVPGGLLLGWVYVKSGRNLVGVVLLHAMIDWIPGAIMVSQVKFGGG